MIECTFSHVADILRKGELRLWQSGITTWEQVVHQSKVHPHFTKRMWKNLREESSRCNHALETNNITFFLEHFPDELLWRFYPNFVGKGKILYLDVEMTGLSLEEDSITSIATIFFDKTKGYQINWFVKDRNLTEFPKLLEKFQAICTFDGARVDIPFIEKEFSISLCHIHFDLFQISRKIHLSGGLKQLEERLKINRFNLDGIDGRTAILLWKKYQVNHNEKYISTLVAYNIEDVIHLPEILFQFYELLRKQEHYPEKSIIRPAFLKLGTIINPKIPDPVIISEILDELQKLEENVEKLS